jgi:hypothetical protein
MYASAHTEPIPLVPAGTEQPLKANFSGNKPSYLFGPKRLAERLVTAPVDLLSTSCRPVDLLTTANNKEEGQRPVW